MLAKTKSVITTIHIYTMQKIWVPIGIWDNIGVMVRSFIWGRNFCHWHNWKNLTKPKFHGVLGIHTSTQISLFLKNTFGLVKSQSGGGVNGLKI
jgi:hypothetical protein